MKRDVFLTGSGVLTACGRGIGPLVAAIAQGKTAALPDPELRALGCRCHVSGRVPDVDDAFVALPFDPASRRFFGRFARIASVAAMDAMADSRNPSIGRVIVATGTGPMGELEACFRDTLPGERHEHRAHAVTRVTPSFVASYLAGVLGATRGGHVVSAACASSMVAFAEAFDLVSSGREEAVLVGGVEEDCASTFWAFDRQRLLGYASSPEDRSRPLSGIAGGFFPAGGAAFFVLESAEHALARNATLHARVVHVTMRSALNDTTVLSFPKAAYQAALADVTRDGPFDLVLAHAPPTLADADELALLAKVASGPIRSYKSIMGYTVGASVAIDVAIGLHHLGKRSVLPNDFEAVAPSVESHSRALLDGTDGPIRRVLKTVYAQGFSAGALVLEAPNALGAGNL